MTSIGSTGIHVPVGGIAAWLAALLLALLSFATPALAADDPPGRVGRVTDSQGQSWFYDTEAGEWSSLERNRPITTGDRVAVDGNGRLELRIGSTAVRLAGGSELEIVRLDDDRVDLMLHSGSAAVRVRSVEVAREVELATADGRFSPRGVAHFRVDRRDDGSVGTAWSGDVHFEADDSALDVTSGRSAEFWREGRQQFHPLQLGRAAARRLCRLDRTRRPRGRSRRRSTVRVARDDRCRGPQSLRHVGPARRIRTGLVPDHGGGGLGAVSLRSLGGRAALGLDLGRLRAVGLRAVPLRAVAVLRRALVLGPGLSRGATGLFTRDGGLGRRPAGLWPRAFAVRRLGAAGAA
jgi:hypothetical protein